jgi:radical SAM superfamily enzyme YgiQ (UPF0313 family)
MPAVPQAHHLPSLLRQADRQHPHQPRLLARGAFCSINAWYQMAAAARFRVRTIENIVAEMKELYFDHGVRIFNFQDDNFFLPNPQKAAARFRLLRERLEEEGVRGIACAVKCRPDSVTEDALAELDQIGLFRVFLASENASQEGLNHLNPRTR